MSALHEKRLEALEALRTIQEIAVKVTTHTDEDTPATLVGNDMARRFFGCVREPLAFYTTGALDPMARIALLVTERIRAHKIRDWRENHDALNRMRSEIDDILFEIIQAENLDIPIEVHDKIIDDCIHVAIANED